MPSTELAYPQGKVLPFQVLNCIFGHGGKEQLVTQWYGVGEGIQRSDCFPHLFLPFLLSLYPQFQRYLVASSHAL